MVPSPRVTRQITTACIKCFIGSDLERIEKEENSDYEFWSDEPTQQEETIGRLLDAAVENWATITDSFKNLLVEQINSGSEREAFISLDLVISLEGFYPEKRLIEYIFDNCYDRIKELCNKHFRICLVAFWRGKVSLVDFIRWYGAEGIFRNGYYNRFQEGLFQEGLVIGGAASKSLRHSILMVSYSSEQSTQSLLEDLREVGGSLLSSSTPRVSRKQSTLYFYTNWDWVEDKNKLSKSESIREQLSQDSNALFGAFALFAVMLEGVEEEEQYLDQIEKSKAPLFDFMRWIFLARSHHREVDTDKVQAEMDKCGFSTQQQEFVWRWVRREINLVGEVAEEETFEV
jgi:hypothetical protein